MSILLLGLIVFLGVHSVRIVAEDWRTRTIASRGVGAWKGMYSALSVVGLGLVVWGYGLARQEPVILWSPPMGMRHAASLLTLVAFVLLTAAYVPRNALRLRLRHPMVLGVKAWALAHLLSNGSLADLLLFGSFLVWAVLSFRAARQRDRQASPAVVSTSALATGLTLVVGIGAWVVFALWLHGPLMGVRPFG
ncbi:MAG: NnrU family protein [Burkholderiaceae bacterium]|jgi:uncharacterized membrane protein|nr:NnrU family protein [Burkholderiaceae bacterium]